MLAQWEEALRKGLELGETPYYKLLGLDEDPFSPDPVSSEENLVDFEREMSTLLTLIGRAGTSGSYIIPIIRLRGGGGTSLINAFISFVGLLGKKRRKGVSSFARRMSIECINARFLTSALDDENSESGHETYADWITRIDQEEKTHIFIDNSEALRRYTVYPYIEAVLDELNRALVFVPCITPSSYNRLLREIAVSSTSAGRLVGEVVVRTFGTHHLRQLISSRFPDAMQFVDSGAFREVHERSLGIPGQALRIMRMLFEEACSTEKRTISRSLAIRVCERSHILSPKNLWDRFTRRQSDLLHCMLYLGDYVTAHEVAEEMDLDRSGMARMLAKLEHEGALHKYRAGAHVVYHIASSIKLILEKELLMRELLASQEEGNEAETEILPC